jgi:hypothetical protein
MFTYTWLFVKTANVTKKADAELKGPLLRVFLHRGKAAFYLNLKRKFFLKCRCEADRINSKHSTLL